MEHSRAKILGPGLGEKVNDLRASLKASLEMVRHLAVELHSSAMFNGNSNHTTRSYRTCKSWICIDARRMIDNMTSEIPELRHNPYALRQYRKNLRELQRKIRTPMQPVVSESLLSQRSD
jgi:hypothetical protein